MTTEHNEQHSDHSEQSLEMVKPAAAQEPVAEVVRNEAGQVAVVFAGGKQVIDYVGAKFYAAPIAAAPYSIDADPQGIRERVAAAITGALAFGSQGNNAPPAGHWLQQFWDIARAEAELRTHAAPGIDLEPAGWQYRVTAGPQTGWSPWMDGRGEKFEKDYTVLRRRVYALIDASPKGDEAQLADATAVTPLPMNTAPRDGTVVRLLVQFEEHLIEDTDEPAWTIGACNDDLVPEDERTGWQVAGWCWEHDHFTEGKGTPVGWLPMLDSPKGGSEAVSVKRNCAPPTWMFPEDGEVSTDWRAKAAAWLEAQAVEQESTNAAYPAHVAAYPSWVDRVHWLRTLSAKVVQAQASDAEVRP